ncbi:MAG: alpha/beta fold hydrolase [Phycisphaeraceae bacterium]|nr:alpha/beta fold hydrolase [Phycisphaeraceae bacterium]
MKATRSIVQSRATLIAILAGLAAVGLPAHAAPAKPADPPKGKIGKYDNNAALTQRANGEKTLVVMIHGFDDTPAMWGNLHASMNRRLPNGINILPAGTAVWEYDWRTDAAGTFGPGLLNKPANFVDAIGTTGGQADNLLHQIITKGRIGGEGQWDHVHLISHSLGAPINELAARGLKKYGVKTVQQTFLDPAIDPDGAMGKWFGGTADVAENYFAPGGALGYVGFTGHTFKSAVNVNVAATTRYIPAVQPNEHHKWPVEWYDEGIRGSGVVDLGPVPKSGYGRFGWGYSYERAMERDNAWPVVDASKHNRGRLITIGNQGWLDSNDKLSVLPEQERTPGVTVDSSAGMATVRTTGDRITGLDLEAMGAAPSWMVLNVDTRNNGPVDAMTFSYSFADSGPSQRDGMFSVLVAYEFEGAFQWLEIFSARQSFNLAGSEDQSSGPVSLWQTFESGEYAVAFVFESLDGQLSGVSVNDITFWNYNAVPAPGATSLVGMGCLVASRRRRV